MKKIDKAPAPLTGDVRKDQQELRNYLVYLREQLNFILTQINKEQNGGN